MLTFAEAIHLEKLDDSKKATQEEVDYQDTPEGDKQCSRCWKYQPAEAGPDGEVDPYPHCLKVEDPIIPTGYCRRFERAATPTVPDSSVGKDATATDVHATTALGNEGGAARRKAVSFLDSLKETARAGGVSVAYLQGNDPPAVAKKKDRTVTVYFVRHGATKMNNQTDMSQDRVRSWNDVDLTDEGREDAKKAGSKLKKYGIEVIASSDLGRAKETAKIAGGAAGIEPVSSPKLRPWNLGDFTGQTTEKANPGITKFVADKPDEVVPGGESFNDFRARAFEGLRWALKKAGNKPLAIVSHHRNERLFAAWTKAGQPADHSIDAKEFMKTGADPGDIEEFEFDLDALEGKDSGGKKVKKAEEPTAALVLNHQIEGMAKSPFPYDQNAFSNLRDDQKERFLAALTDQDQLPVKTVRLSSLSAIQDRVDPNKVEAMRENAPEKLPLVIRTMPGRLVIGDGHHRLTAYLIDGRKTVEVRFADIAEVDEQVSRDNNEGSSGEDAISKSFMEIEFDVCKTAEDRQLVFGWASVCSIDGVVVVDKQGDIIPEEEMEEAAYNFALYCRKQGDMHERMGVGRMVESIAFTKEKQQALGIDLGQTGWWVGFRVDDVGVWKKIKDGSLPEFSIGGKAVREAI